MNRANAPKTAYIIKSIQSLSKYTKLIDNFAPTEKFDTDYDRFMKVFASLQSWGDWLDNIAIDTRHMNWLNAVTQSQALSMRNDVHSYLNALKQIALAHFKTGSSLDVPGDIFNYYANFNRIPIPSIKIAEGAAGNKGNGGPLDSAVGYYLCVGYVDIGPISSTVSGAFPSIELQWKGQSIGRTVNVYYNPKSFQNDLATSIIKGDDSNSYYGAAKKFLDSTTWSQISQAQGADGTRYGFFWAAFQWNGNDLSGTAQMEENSLVLKDAAGQLVDAVGILTRNSSLSSQSLHASPASDLSVALISPPQSVSFASPLVQELLVANKGPGSAYGITLSIPLDSDTFQFVSVTGSQGYGGLTNRVIAFNIGPLANGSSATLQLTTLPLGVGRQTLGASAVVRVGSGLTDNTPENNEAVFSPVTVSCPPLSIVRQGAELELSWDSRAVGATLHETANVEVARPWPTSNAVVLPGNKALVSPSGNRRFFRLEGL